VSNNLGIHARTRGAAYVAADFRALRRFSLSVAAREEIWRDLSATLKPTIAGGAWVNPRFKFRASASRAFRVPSYTELYYSDPADFGNPTCGRKAPGPTKPASIGSPTPACAPS
jgi:iron complex outermembrane receptor protein